MAGKGPDRRYPEMVLELLGSNNWAYFPPGTPLHESFYWNFNLARIHIYYLKYMSSPFPT